MEHHGIEAHSSTAPQTQKQNQTEIKIPSTADRWIQVYEYAAGTNQEKYAAVRRWEAYLYSTCRYQVGAWYRSSAVTPLSGRVSYERRVGRIPSTVDHLYQKLQRTPTAAEVVESLNSEMRRREKKPREHGSLMSLEEAALFL